jgi:sugar phosphate isomerase/epimerase
MSTQAFRSDLYSRRGIAHLAIAGLAAPVLGAFGAGPVRLAVNAASFRGLPRKPDGDAIDAVIQALTDCGVRDCELSASLLEPSYGAEPGEHHHATMAAMTPQMMRRELRKWRLRTPASYFEAIGRRFERAGIAVSAYSYGPDTTFTSEEIDRGLVAARALGAEVVTADMSLAIAERVAPAADRHRMAVALTGECAASEPGSQLPRPARVAAALGLSRYFKVNLDVGLFAADDCDPVAFLRDHHAEIASIHLKDCRGRGKEAVEWGQGQTPIREVLQLLKREGWPIRAYVDYAYAGTGTPVEEVKRCFAYARAALA